MTKEQINIAIAEACGYKNVAIGMTEGTIRVITGFKHHTFNEEIPDYCNDLNAMHKAEKVLSDELHADYACELVKTIRQNGEWFESVSATARQRAGAFLRTINKREGGSDDN